MGIQEAIRSAQAALEALQAGAYEIIRKTAPCNWGSLQAWLITELQRIKTEGGIEVNPPEVILPDGVTSTSEVTQSEMTQFVTNTLNTWLGGIAPTPGPDPELEFFNKLLYPEACFLYDVDWDSITRPRFAHATKGQDLTIEYFANYDKYIAELKDPSFGTRLFTVGGASSSGSSAPTSYMLFERPEEFNWFNPLTLYQMAQGTGSDYVLVRFLTTLINEDLSNYLSVGSMTKHFEIMYSSNCLRTVDIRESGVSTGKVGMIPIYYPYDTDDIGGSVGMSVEFHTRTVGSDGFDFVPLFQVHFPEALPAGTKIKDVFVALTYNKEVLT